MRFVVCEVGVEYPRLPDRPIKTPDDVRLVLQETVKQLDREAFFVLNLSAKNFLISCDMVSLGILDATLVHPREIFREACKKPTAAIVLAHNHPAGDPTPSAEDIKITRQLVEAGKILDIPVLDHVILTNERIMSIREHGLVDFS